MKIEKFIAMNALSWRFYLERPNLWSRMQRAASLFQGLISPGKFQTQNTLELKLSPHKIYSGFLAVFEPHSMGEFLLESIHW